MKVVAAALLFCTIAAGGAKAGCIHFEESAAGDAYLTNSCAMGMNVAYGVTAAGGGTISSDRQLQRTPVEPFGRKLVWSAGRAPVAGQYAVKIFSCAAPTSLVYPAMGRPTCQLGMADAG